MVLNPLPDPFATEDSDNRFGPQGSPPEVRLPHRWVRREHILIDGANAGSTVEYVVEVTALDPQDINLLIKDPGVGGQVINGSRWQASDIGALTTPPDVFSSTVTSTQRVVVDWMIVSAGIGVQNPTQLQSPVIVIRSASTASTTVYHQVSGTIPVLGGGVLIVDGPLVIQGALGDQLEATITSDVQVIQASISFGGYVTASTST